MTASGIRVGSAALTTQGMGQPEMAEVASLIARAIKAEPGTAAGDAELASIADAVGQLVAANPAYPAASR